MQIIRHPRPFHLPVPHPSTFYLPSHLMTQNSDWTPPKGTITGWLLQARRREGRKENGPSQLSLPEGHLPAVPLKNPTYSPLSTFPLAASPSCRSKAMNGAFYSGWQCARLKRRSLLPGKTSRVGREGEPAAKCTGNSSRQTSTSDADGRSWPALQVSCMCVSMSRNERERDWITLPVSYLLVTISFYFFYILDKSLNYSVP